METEEGTQEQHDPSLWCTRGGTYSVQMPYGYRLDLDFLRCVEEMERGCKRSAPRRPQQDLRTRARRARVERALMEVRQRLQLARRSHSDGLAELNGPDFIHVSQGNSSDPEFDQSHASSPLSPAYSPASSDDLASSQDSGVGPDMVEEGKGEGQGWGCWPVAVGYDSPLEESRDLRDVAMVTELVDTCEVDVWTDLEELDTLRRTVEIQRQRIQDLEAQLSRALQEQEALRQEQEALRQEQEQEALRQEQEALRQEQEQEALRQEQEALRQEQEQDNSRTGGGKVCTKALMHKTQVDPEPCPGCTWARSHMELPEDTGGCVGEGQGDTGGCVGEGQGDTGGCVGEGQGDTGGCVGEGQGDTGGCVGEGQGDTGGCVGEGFLWKGAGGTQSATLQRNDQSTQTDFAGGLKRNASLSVTSRGTQWESPDAENTSIIPAVQKEEGTQSHPAAGKLKSIMKRPGEDRASSFRAGHRKCLQFVEILKRGYESTSSEEEEDEDEEDEGEKEDSSPPASGSSGVEESQDDSSFQERTINPDEFESEEEKEKFELSDKMREACLILKSHLDDDISAVHGDDVLASSHTVEQEWFRVSSSRTSTPAHISSFLAAFAQLFPGLVECVVNMADLQGNTALHYSLSYSNFTVARVLLDTGVCCVDRWNKAGYTPVMLAAVATMRTAENMQLIRQLFRQGNINARAEQTGQTALMLAVGRRRMEVVWALMDSGADVNAQDREGRTALMNACQKGHAPMVSLLLQHPCCDITLKSNAGETAVSIAVEASHSDIAVLLYTHMNRSIPPTPTGPSPTPSTEIPKAIPGRPPLPKKKATQGQPQVAKMEKLKVRSCIPGNSQVLKIYESTYDSF